MGWQVAKVRGVPVIVTPFALVVAAGLGLLLKEALAPALDMGPAHLTRFVIILVALATLSLLIHEIGHAIAARREGLEVIAIAFWGFGAVTAIGGRSDRTPGPHFRVIAAGPLATMLVILFCAGLGGVLYGWTPSDWVSGGFVDFDDEVQVALALTMAYNAITLAFNLLPGLPLDGGWMLRDILWTLGAGRAKATRVAATLGVIGGAMQIFWGVIRFGAEGDTLSLMIWGLGGYWGMRCAYAGVGQERLFAKLERTPVSAALDPDLVPMDAHTTAGDAWRQLFGRWEEVLYVPVVDAGRRYLGLAHRRAVKDAAERAGDTIAVRLLVEPPAMDGMAQRVAADASLDSVIESRVLGRGGTLVVLDDQDRLVSCARLPAVQRALESNAR